MRKRSIEERRRRRRKGRRRRRRRRRWRRRRKRRRRRRRKRSRRKKKKKKKRKKKKEKNEEMKKRNELETTNKNKLTTLHTFSALTPSVMTSSIIRWLFDIFSRKLGPYQPSQFVLSHNASTITLQPPRALSRTAWSSRCDAISGQNDTQQLGKFDNIDPYNQIKNAISTDNNRLMVRWARGWRVCVSARGGGGVGVLFIGSCTTSARIALKRTHYDNFIVHSAKKESKHFFKFRFFI